MPGKSSHSVWCKLLSACIKQSPGSSSLAVLCSACPWRLSVCDSVHLCRPECAADCIPNPAALRRYTGQADWQYIGQCAQGCTSELQLIGNGDVFHWQEYEGRLQAAPQLATAMIARAALIKPWIFTEVSAALPSAHHPGAASIALLSSVRQPRDALTLMQPKGLCLPAWALSTC